MPAATVCVIHEAIGNQSAIAKVTMNGVRAALDAGWRVTVVAKMLDESLRADVEWLRLYVPPRLFFVQWTTARAFIQSALGKRKFDVIHAHQPQVADLSDVFQCHFLTRAAYERKCLDSRPGIRPAIIRLQQRGVLRAEDYFYRGWNPETWMLFGSDLLRDEFQRLYGAPPKQDVLTFACPMFNAPSQEERRRARVSVIGVEPRGIVVGYLGGVDERKGYKRVIEGLKSSEDTFLLMGGSYSDTHAVPSLGGRFKGVGLVQDTSTFYAACDVFIVPSVFEPYGLVAAEAAARAVPVIATREVGALPQLLKYGAGARWSPGESLPNLIRDTVARRAEYHAGARRMCDALSADHYARQLMGVYDRVFVERKSVKAPASRPMPEGASSGRATGKS